MKSTGAGGAAGEPWSVMCFGLFYVGHNLATPGGMAQDERRRRRSSDAQLDAAVEGARDMFETRRRAESTDRHAVTQKPGGPPPGTSQGGSNGTAGSDDRSKASATERAADPAAR